MFDKRVTVFMGHYGSGKTFISVNYAIALAKLNKSVSIYDLDIVNRLKKRTILLDSGRIVKDYKEGEFVNEGF